MLRVCAVFVCVDHAGLQPKIKLSILFRWEKVSYKIFDIPSMKDKPFETRLQHLSTLFPDHKHLHIVKHTKCQNNDHLKQELDRVHKLGGEGLMLRQPGSKYVGSRSSTLLKVKSFYDAEAKVIGHQDGKGRHVGRMGALEMVMESGKKFKIGSGFSDRERDNPPPIGSIVTYRFQELTPDGIPRFPTYVGIRIDMDAPKDAKIRAVTTD
eukprot:m.71039 g.71039  ORF g.71039 m.71039 type:complete len:210 (+) comp20130_c0_seq1:1673-2302(+)